MANAFETGTKKDIAAIHAQLNRFLLKQNIIEI